MKCAENSYSTVLVRFVILTPTVWLKCVIKHTHSESHFVVFKGTVINENIQICYKNTIGYCLEYFSIISPIIRLSVRENFVWVLFGIHTEKNPTI